MFIVFRKVIFFKCEKIYTRESVPFRFQWGMTQRWRPNPCFYIFGQIDHFKWNNTLILFHPFRKTVRVFHGKFCMIFFSPSLCCKIIHKMFLSVSATMRLSTENRIKISQPTKYKCTVYKSLYCKTVKKSLKLFFLIFTFETHASFAIHI